jgi:uncharacterized protein YjbJ (UPF0337 family)
LDACALHFPERQRKLQGKHLLDEWEKIMNKDVFEGKWKQIEGEAKAWWGKLTDDDLKRVAGKYDVFVGVIQEKYGYTRQHATDEIEKHVTEFEANLKNKTLPASAK